MKIDRIPYKKLVLDNGFVIYYMKRPVPDAVYMSIHYRSGSGYERDGIRGISHFLEHLMFKGTVKYPKNYLTELLSPHGGSANAYTSWDSTVFYATFPRELSKDVFSYEKDRMENLLFEDFDKELSVVLDEKRLTIMDNPFGLYSERLFYLTFLLHPYRYPVIGLLKDLESMTLDKVRAYYNEFYAPQNAFMVLSGNVTEEVIGTASSIFNSINKYGKFHRVPSCKLEPEQGELRAFNMRRSGFGAKVLTVLFKTVPFSHDDTPYLDVLSCMLGDGKNSYLYKKMVENESIFTSVSTEVYETQSCTLHSIVATIRNDMDSKKAAEKLLRLLESPRGFFTKKRFKEAIFKTQIDIIYSRENIKNIGSALGEFALFSDAEDINRYLERLARLQFDKTEEVFFRYFGPEYATLGVIEG